jgi:hypothetical protein
VAWQLSSEAVWHRCAADPTVTLTSPAEGRYTLAAQDETAPCMDTETRRPGRNDTFVTGSLVVDGTQPAIARPIVNAPAAVVLGARPIVRIEAAVSDPLAAG